MIYSLSGKVTHAAQDLAVIEVGGVGYGVFVPQRHVGDKIKAGDELKILTVTVVSQDDVRLFGFLSSIDREFFRMLTGIPRLGPKNAMRIISFAPAARIIQAILAEDEKFLKGIPGIGPKVAKRLIVELPEKVRAITREEDVEYEDVFDEVVEVLTGLGCSPEESGRLINEVKKSAKKKDMGFDELLAESLRIMAREEAGL